LRADATQPARRALRFAPIIDRRLDLGAKPEVVCFGFFGRIEFGDEGVERVAMSITVCSSIYYGATQMVRHFSY